MGQTPVPAPAPVLYAVNVAITNWGGKLAVHPSTAFLHINLNEEVVWECSSDFEVDFGKDTPFAKNKFSQADPKSGLPTVPPRTEPYKYTVTMGGQKLDPNVIIQP